MNTSWRPEYAVRWREGMFLLPAHYQLTDRRTEFLLARRFAASQPLAWGVIRQQLDVTQLGSGFFRVLEIEAILPDGLYVHHVQAPVAEAAPLERTPPVLEIKIEEKSDTVQTVWLAVPLASPNPTDESENHRYRDTEFSIMEPSSEESQPISLLAPNISLHLGDPPSRFAAIPIAKVSFKAEGFCLEPYLPPQLLIRRDCPIFDMLLGVVTNIRNTTTALVHREEELHRQDQDGRFDSLLIPLGHLPMLETLLFTESVSPLMLFGALANLYGSICSTGHQTIPRRFEYDHYDPQRCFTELVEELQLELEIRVPKRHLEILFTRQEGVFSLEYRHLPESGTIVIGVTKRSGSDSEKVGSWIKNAVIGYRDDIESLQQRRTTGMNRKPVTDTGALIFARNQLFWELAIDRRSDDKGPLQIVGAPEMSEQVRPAYISLLKPVNQSAQ